MSQTLAQAFIESGLVNEADIETALTRQRELGGNLDTALIETRAVLANDALRIIREHTALPTVDRSNIDTIDRNIARTFPRHFAETYNLIPYEMEGQTLRLIVSNPPHDKVLGRIEARIQMKPEIHITLEANLHYGMQRLYGKAPTKRIQSVLSWLDNEPTELPRDQEPEPEFEPAQTAPTMPPMVLETHEVPAEAPLAAPPSAETDDVEPRPSIVTHEPITSTVSYVSQEVEAAQPAAPTTNQNRDSQSPDELTYLLSQLGGRDQTARAEAITRLTALGEAVFPEVHRRFPGNMTFDPFAADIQLPPFSACSGLLQFISELGGLAVPIVLPHLDSDDSAQRFFAIYYLYSIHYPAALPLLARRLYDTEPANRFLAAEAMRYYRKTPEYPRIVEDLLARLSLPMIDMQITIMQILGQLREATAVPAMLPFLASSDKRLILASSSSLAVICAQEFGTNIEQWANWWRDHYRQPRARWLVMGLRHPNPAIRRIANSELRMLSGETMEYNADQSDVNREGATVRWEQWLDEQLSTAQS